MKPTYRTEKVALNLNEVYARRSVNQIQMSSRRQFCVFLERRGGSGLSYRAGPFRT